jgi:hypothetical protein
MKANVGDWLVIKGTTTERSDQRGLITEVHSADGSPPYVVRWLATGHVATVVPGSDAIVVTPEEHAAEVVGFSDPLEPMHSGSGAEGAPGQPGGQPTSRQGDHCAGAVNSARPQEVTARRRRVWTIG